MGSPALRLRVEEDSIPWRATRYPGVFWHPLDERSSAPEAGIDSAVLIRMNPGCGYPAHRHLGAEDVLVLQGGYRDELGEHGAGAYLRYPPGSAHSPLASGDPRRSPGAENPACILFALARGGVLNLQVVALSGPE